jgi:lipopolysaccharide O-acetyltransferase
MQGAQHMRFGSRVVIAENSWLAAFDRYADRTHTPSLSIGSDVTIGRYACVTAINQIDIGDGCLISEHVYISDHIHEHAPDGGLLVRQPLSSKGPVRIGPSCFLGYRVAVLPGVTLGAHCVVGAHSVVTRSFPAHSMLAGAPAQLIRRFNPSTNAWEAT